MRKILSGNEYYSLDDKVFDNLVQNCLIDNSWDSICGREDDIFSYIVDNAADMLSNLFIDIDEDCDLTDFEEGLREYLDYLSGFCSK